MGNVFTPELQKLLDLVGKAALDIANANDESAARSCNADRIQARMRACNTLDFDGDWLSVCEAAKVSRGDIAREIGDFQEATANAVLRGGAADHNRLVEAERALRAAAYRPIPAEVPATSQNGQTDSKTDISGNSKPPHEVNNCARYIRQRRTEVRNGIGLRKTKKQLIQDFLQTEDKKQIDAMDRQLRKDRWGHLLSIGEKRN